MARVELEVGLLQLVLLGAQQLLELAQAGGLLLQPVVGLLQLFLDESFFVAMRVQPCQSLLTSEN